jgi:gamma-glutamyltranspeptidase
MIIKKVVKLSAIILLASSILYPAVKEGQAQIHPSNVNPYYDQQAVASGNGGAVATEHPLASQAAIEIMEKGGNAVDAAIAAAAVQNVTRPFSGGVGGGGMMNIFLAEEKKNVTLTHREMAPGYFDIEAFEDEQGNIYDYEQRRNSGRAVGVPGNVLAWEEALADYGTMTLADVLQPAIKIAKEGFIIDENFVREVRENQDRFKLFTSTSDLFLKDGNVPEAGSVLKNPDLAKTFELISEHGSDVFYKGEIGKAIMEAVNNPPAALETPYEILPASMTWDDLASYEVVTGAAIESTYKDYNVFGMPLVSSGGLLIGEILNILEGYDLSEMSETEYLHHYIEATRLGFADRAEYHGDPTVIDVPIIGLLSKGFAISRQQKIGERASVGKVAPGDAWYYEENPYHLPEPLPEVKPGFSVDFTGDEGGAWKKDAFFVDTSYDTSYQLDGSGFGKINIGDRRNTAGRAASEMKLTKNKELLMPFRIDDIGPNRYLRIWLRADGFNRSASPHNGYGVEIRSGWNNIRLIKTVDSNEIEEVARFNRTLSSDRQWLRFKVVDDQLSVKVWNDGEEEPYLWNLVEVDNSIEDPGRLLISSIEFAESGGGGGFSIGEIEVVETEERTPLPDDLPPGFEYDFSGEEGSIWDSSKFETDTTEDGIINLNGNGFGQLILADKDRSSARASSIMKPAEDSELLVSFRMDVSPSRDLRFWLRADYLNNLQSPVNGYGVDIRTAWNSIRLIKTVNGQLHEIGRFIHPVTEDLQWLRFRVEGDQQYIKIWKDGNQEPSQWNIVEQDTSITEPGRLLISGREYRNGEGAGNFYIGNLAVEELNGNYSEEENQDPAEEGAPGNSETIHLTVADPQGNVVAYTNTIVSIGGSGIVVPGYGFMLNDVLANRVRIYADEGEPNSALAGAKPLSTMSPTIILKDGEAVFAGGAPGSLTIITTVTQIILGYLERGMSLPEAVEMARISQQNKISGVTIVEPAFTETQEYQELKALGHKFEVSPLAQGIGAFTGIVFGSNGHKEAVSEAVRRGGGSAMAFDLPTESETSLQEVKEQIQTLEMNNGIRTAFLKKVESSERHFAKADHFEQEGNTEEAEISRNEGYQQLRNLIKEIRNKPDHLISAEGKEILSSKLEYLIQHKTAH